MTKCVKICAVAIIICLLLVSAAIAMDEDNVLMPKFGSKLTADELAKVKQMVVAAYPKAARQVVQFFGDEKALKSIRNFKVAVQDSPSNSVHCGSYTLSGKRSGVQAATLFGAQFLTGNCNAESTLATYMIQAAIESKYDYDEIADMPFWLREGLIAYKTDTYKEKLALELNVVTVDLDEKKLMEKKQTKQSARSALFGYCLDQKFGKGAADKLIAILADGKDWRKGFETATGVDYKTARKQVDQCITGYLKHFLNKEAAFAEIHKAYKGKNYPKVVNLGPSFLKEHKDSQFKALATFEVATSYMEAGNTAGAIVLFEQLRIGQLGRTYLNEVAAYGVLFGMIMQGDCDQSKKRYEEFSRYYPALILQWADKWTEDRGMYCND